MSSLLRHLGGKLPRRLRQALSRWRWSFKGHEVHLGPGVRIDWRTNLSDHVSAGAGTTLFGCDIGRHTYFGEDALAVHASIGAFCSIAAHAIIGGGTHPTRDWVSTSPYFHCTRHNPGLRQTETFAHDPKTTVGNDVWIGYSAIILPGVTVGDGAVIAAGAVVSRDVEPYQIVAGVPAKPMRTRFSREEIAWLLEARWWEWDDERLATFGPHFSKLEHLRAATAAQNENPAQPVFSRGTTKETRLKL